MAYKPNTPDRRACFEVHLSPIVYTGLERSTVKIIGQNASWKSKIDTMQVAFENENTDKNAVLGWSGTPGMHGGCLLRCMPTGLGA